MRHSLVHRVGRSSQATPAAVDKSQSASHTKLLTLPAQPAPRRSIARSAHRIASGKPSRAFVRRFADTRLILLGVDIEIDPGLFSPVAMSLLQS